MEKRSTSELKLVLQSHEKFTKEAVEAAVAVLKSRSEKFEEMVPLKAQEPTRAVRKKPFRHLRLLFAFILHPDTHRIQTSSKTKVLLTVRFYFLGLLLQFFVANFFMLVYHAGGVKFPQHKNILPDLPTGTADLYLYAMLIPVFAGVIEELIFRLPFTRFNKLYIDVFLALFISYVITRFFSKSLYFQLSSASAHLVFYTILPIALATGVYFSLRRSHVHSNFLQSDWQRNYRFLFYASAVVFSVLHLPNYNWLGQHLPLIPLVLLPYLVYAFVLSYIRTRNGLVYAIGLHFTIDLFVVLVHLSGINAV